MKMRHQAQLQSMRKPEQRLQQGMKWRPYLDFIRYDVTDLLTVLKYRIRFIVILLIVNCKILGIHYCHRFVIEIVLVDHGLRCMVFVIIRLLFSSSYYFGYGIIKFEKV